jgi:hypothetical protein
MLDGSKRKSMSVSEVYRSLRQRLSRCTTVSVVAAFVVLVAFSLLLFGVHTKIPGLRRKTPAVMQSMALNHVYNRTLGVS